MNAIRQLLSLSLLTCCVEIALMPRSALADQEGQVPLTHVQFDSKGLDNSGPVHADTTQSERGIVDLRVSAFGKSYVLTPVQLATLKGMAFNSIGMTYSRGYTITGGRKFFILLCEGFSSGVSVIATVTIAESGSVRVDVKKKD
jgi:hypothetical protein